MSSICTQFGRQPTLSGIWSAVLKPTAANLLLRRPRRVTGVASYGWMGCNRSFSARCWVRCPPDLDCSHWISAASKFNRFHSGIISFVKRALKRVRSSAGRECDDVCVRQWTTTFGELLTCPIPASIGFRRGMLYEQSHYYQPLSLIGNHNDSLAPIPVPCTRRRCPRQRFLHAGLPARW